MNFELTEVLSKIIYNYDEVLEDAVNQEFEQEGA